jgi:hypothetical protein
MILNGGSANVVSTILIKKLNLNNTKHHKPYRL